MSKVHFPFAGHPVVSFMQVLLLVTLCAVTGVASAALPIPVAPELSAKSYLLIDFHSGRDLAAKNADERIEPASITKVMTSYVLYRVLGEGRVKETDLVTISKKAWKMEGSRMFIEVGDQVPLGELMKGMIIQSGNDSSVAIAEHIGGSEEVFVSMMNAEAQRLGMTGTHFMNATGLPDPQHYTTARDIATLSKHLISEYPTHYQMYSQKEFTYGGIKQTNRNRMLWLDKRIDGIKTGHTESAGYCLAASGVENGTRLISVVLGTDSEAERTQQTRSLMNYGFRFFETRLVHKGGVPLAKAKIWKGASDELALGIADDLYLTFPRGQFEQLNGVVDRSKIIEAPVQAGEHMGVFRVTLDGVMLAELPVLALNSVAEGSFLDQALDSLKLWWDE